MIFTAKNFSLLVECVKQSGYEKSSGYLKRKNGMWIFEVKDETR